MLLPRRARRAATLRPSLSLTRLSGCERRRRRRRSCRGCGGGGGGSPALSPPLPHLGLRPRLASHVVHVVVEQQGDAILLPWLDVAVRAERDSLILRHEAPGQLARHAVEQGRVDTVQGDLEALLRNRRAKSNCRLLFRSDERARRPDERDQKPRVRRLPLLLLPRGGAAVVRRLLSPRRRRQRPQRRPGVRVNVAARQQGAPAVIQHRVGRAVRGRHATSRVGGAVGERDERCDRLLAAAHGLPVTWPAADW